MTIMKDSGIEWIGQIPKNWIEVPFKAYFTTGKGLSFTKADLTPQGHAVVSYGQVHSKANTGTRLDDSLLRYVPDSITENGESSRMNKGDFIFADTSEDLEGCGNCVYVDRDIELYAGYHSVTAKPKAQYNNKFFAYYFQTPCWRNQIRSRVTGIKVFSISQSIINKTWLFVPPLLTQQKIANYLDKVCSDIDDMITLQEQMIEELKAYRQSIITEAVTKGLNPNAPMKDSGVDWIGEVPEGWKVCKLKNIYQLLNGRAYLDPELFEEGKYRILRVGNLFSSDKWYYSDMELEDNKYCQSGDLLYGWSASIGPYIWEGEKVIYHYHIWKVLFGNNNLHYSYYLLYALTLAKQRDMHGSAMQHLTKTNMDNSFIAFPPLSEQQAIASYLDSKCSEIDALIAIKQQKIEELKDYKKSVIYEYVTGKKEVV